MPRDKDFDDYLARGDLPPESSGPLKGQRFNQGKAPVHLVSPSVIMAIASVSQNGAEKYGERNWEKGMKYSAIYSSLMRHLMAWWQDEDVDLESGLPHTHHIAWNAMALVEYERRMNNGSLHPSADDRPTYGYTPEGSE